jgi:hypothetical protein
MEFFTDGWKPNQVLVSFDYSGEERSGKKTRYNFNDKKNLDQKGIQDAV